MFIFLGVRTPEKVIDVLFLKLDTGVSKILIQRHTVEKIGKTIGGTNLGEVLIFFMFKKIGTGVPKNSWCIVEKMLNTISHVIKIFILVN
jgi:hypothetical protein